MSEKVDIKENNILRLDAQLLDILLQDKTTDSHIIWATDDYAHMGISWESSHRINKICITGKNGNVIMPRIEKTRLNQKIRAREKAEVFTPSWVCNKQNNLVDSAWFGRENVFNIEHGNSWESISTPIEFPSISGKTWQDYIFTKRLEVACGEAPYLVSRYDTVTGQPIPVSNRIGLLDRKLRIVSENTETEDDWYNWATIAIQSIYGYEWQGDNLLLARENILYTYEDFFYEKFRHNPPKKRLIEMAKIIAWNIWQMDGMRYVVPNSCHIDHQQINTLWGYENRDCECEGCLTGNPHKHNGIYCKIKDWQANKIVKYVKLIGRA